MAGSQTNSFANLPSPFSFPFLLHPNPQMAVSLCCEFCHSSHRKAVCQIVSQYSLTFSPRAHSMKHHYTLFSRLSIRQLNLISKYWNELLRRWRSGLIIYFTNKWQATYTKWTGKIDITQNSLTEKILDLTVVHKIMTSPPPQGCKVLRSSCLSTSCLSASIS